MKSLTQRLKRLKDDERGVSPVVGFVLIFALIMIVFTLYQSSVVPAQNKEVEFKHSQIVEGEMSELNDAIQQAGASGVPQSVTIDTGVQYPDRALAINPGTPVGTLKTSDNKRDVTITGLRGGNDYWKEDHTFADATRTVSYRPSYNILQDETTYALENGVYATKYDSGKALLKSNGSIATDNGNRINLLLIGGDYQKSAMSSSVTANPVSSSTEYRRLETGSSGGTIKLPTEFSADVWESILEEKEYADFGGISGSGDNRVATINLDSNHAYFLRITKVNIGGSSSPELAYLGNESKLTRTGTLDSPETLAVSARDKFGNLYTRGASIDAEIVGGTGSGTFVRSDSDTASTGTGDDGQAMFRYRPGKEDAGSEVEIKLTLSKDGALIDTTTYEITFSETEDKGSSDGGILGSGDITNGYALEPSIVTIDSATYKKSDGPVVLKFNNTGETPMKAVQVQLNGAIGQKNHPIKSGTFHREPITLNGRNVNLTNQPDISDSDNTFTVDPDDPERIEFQYDSGMMNEGGFLLVTVQYSYEYEMGGETKTGIDTATYAVSVSKS